jgi:hypothetical protein
MYSVEIRHYKPRELWKIPPKKEIFQPLISHYPQAAVIPKLFNDAILSK